MTLIIIFVIEFISNLCENIHKPADNRNLTGAKSPKRQRGEQIKWKDKIKPNQQDSGK